MAKHGRGTLGQMLLDSIMEVSYCATYVPVSATVTYDFIHHVLSEADFLEGCLAIKSGAIWLFILFLT